MKCRGCRRFLYLPRQ
ncbi:MAG: hypothetical protein E7416_00050 [Ruminococcaceae bacterium]|nr:hypothetical protein [Oscillospiraceae bacterium]